MIDQAGIAAPQGAAVPAFPFLPAERMLQFQGDRNRYRAGAFRARPVRIRKSRSPFVLRPLLLPASIGNVRLAHFRRVRGYDRLSTSGIRRARSHPTTWEKVGTHRRIIWRIVFAGHERLLPGSAARATPFRDFSGNSFVRGAARGSAASDGGDEPQAHREAGADKPGP